MTAQEIIESVGGKVIESWPIIISFQVPEMPGVTIRMYEHSIKSAADVERHIEWKRSQFGPAANLEKKW